MACLLRIIASMLSTLGFAMLFRVKGKHLIATTVGGLLCGLIFEWISLVSEGLVVCYFVTTLCLSLYAEIMARVLKAPVTTYLPATIIPLVPGGALYYAMSSVLEGNMETAVGYATNACYIALAITAGVMVITPIREFIKRY